MAWSIKLFWIQHAASMLFTSFGRSANPAYLSDNPIITEVSARAFNDGKCKTCFRPKNFIAAAKVTKPPFGIAQKPWDPSCLANTSNEQPNYTLICRVWVSCRPWGLKGAIASWLRLHLCQVLLTANNQNGVCWFFGRFVFSAEMGVLANTNKPVKQVLWFCLVWVFFPSKWLIELLNKDSPTAGVFGRVRHPWSSTTFWDIKKILLLSPAPMRFTLKVFIPFKTSKLGRAASRKADIAWFSWRLQEFCWEMFGNRKPRVERSFEKEMSSKIYQIR